MSASIWLVTGVPGAGKTSVCAALAARYERALHVEADALMETGVHRHGASDRAGRRVLERRAIARLVAEYAAAGLSVIVDDTLENEAEAAAYVEVLPDIRRALLLPTLEATLARNAARANKPEGDAPMLDAIARRLYEPLRRAHTAARGWFVLDTTGLSVADAIDALVARFGL